MSKFEYEYRLRDRELILSQEASLLTESDYVRIIVYPAEADNTIVRLPESNVKAIFYASLSQTQFTIDTTPFYNNTNNPSQRTIGGVDENGDSQFNDFKIFRTLGAGENYHDYSLDNRNFYIKPNEIFNDFQLPQGDYKIQIDFLNQIQPSFGEGIDQSINGYPFPADDFNGNGDVIATTVLWNHDEVALTANQLPDIGIEIVFALDGDWDTDWVVATNPENTNGLTFKPGNRYEFYGHTPLTLEDSFFWDPDAYLNPGSELYPFVIKQISPSRKEIRLKIIDTFITKNSDIITNITNKFNNFEPEFLDDGEPNPNYKYQFKHVLNIGTGDHIPIMNYAFDGITDGKGNQSLIIKLYDAATPFLNNLDRVTIEKEVLTTQVQDIYYFSDVPDIFFGDGLIPDKQEDWINIDGGEVKFENYNNLTQSIDNITLDNIISSSYDYPNLNTDFKFFKNHTFFGSAKKKLQNFKEKVKKIQDYYSEISNSLNISSSITGDSDYIIQLRKTNFNLIDGSSAFKT